MAKVELVNQQDEIDFEFLQNYDLVKMRFNMKGNYELKLLFTDLDGIQYKINSTFLISEINNKKKIMDKVNEEKSP